MSDPADPRPSFNPLAQRSWTDLGPRVISAAVLLILAIAGLYVGGYVFGAVVGAVFAGCYREWDRMVTLKSLTPVGIVLIGLVWLAGLATVAFGGWWGVAVVALGAIVASADPAGPRAWRVAGVAFYGIVTVLLVILRGRTNWAGFDDGMWAGVFLGAVIWATDTGAYFTGRQVGGEKLAPDISPSKTWSGAIGGLALGTLAGLVCWLLVAPVSPWWIGLVIAAATSVLGQAGDLAESALKRRFRIKDSGDIIPGHGGLMDRLDSLTFGVLFLVAVGALHMGQGTIAMGLLNW